MSLHSLILSIASSTLVLLFLTLVDLYRGFAARRFPDEKQFRRSVQQDVEIKDGDMKPGIDPIRVLPCSIIDKIFGFLQLPDIVKLSTLSRAWRSSCLTCPELTFNFRFDRSLVRGQKLELLIHDMLIHHQGSLLKFGVQVNDLESSPEIDEWIELLPDNTLQDLTIEISIGEKHKMTSRMFTFQNLRNLRLCNCVFNPLGGFEGFPKLVNIHFQSVGFVPENFVEFLCSCPAVETLRLLHCTKFDCLEITAPKLKFLEFVGSFRLVSFVNCHLLSEVRLTFPSVDIEESIVLPFDLVNSLSCLPMLEELSLQAYALEGLVEYGAPNKLPLSLKHLKSLHVMDMYFEKPAEASGAICFIRSCPNLPNLRISALTSAAVDTVSVAEFLQQEPVPKSLTSLKSVKMIGLCGNESEMEFVKFLLASASALEEMTIRPYMGTDLDYGESIVTEVKQYPRASSEVKICSLVRNLSVALVKI